VERPNILIIYTDQQRWDALGVNGNAEIHTPNLDQLAGKGLNFSHYFVQNPLCMPSRISFMSGRYPSALGITHMGVPVPEEVVTLPKLLRNYGYTTANIGKLHFLPHANRDHRGIHPDYGFSHLEISDEPGCYEDAYRAWVRRKAPDQLPYLSVGLPPAAKVWQEVMGIRDEVPHAQRGRLQAVPFPGSEEVTHSAFVADQARSFIERHSEGPWLCVAGFYSPHAPWVVPQRFLDLYDRESLSLPEYPSHINELRSDQRCPDNELRSIKQGYYAMVSEVDHYVGELIDYLDQKGLSENTIVVFTSDHGEYLGDHLRYNKGYPGEDCISRVPMILSWPKGIRHPGRVCSQIVEAVDVVPTLLGCAGIPVPGYIQGSSLEAAMRDEPFTGKPCAIMEFTGWKNIRTERYRYLLENDGREALFDLQHDPMQYANVAGQPDYGEVLNHMRKAMLTRVLQIEQPREAVWPY
jgi:arylsulfatase A-like enzyme